LHQTALVQFRAAAGERWPSGGSDDQPTGIPDAVEV